MGVLRTAEPGDISYTKEGQLRDGVFSIPSASDDRFAVEKPTDADAFYNMIIRVRHDGPIYNPGAGSEVQSFHYFTLVLFLYWPLAIFGYPIFKVLWLITSLIGVVAGTALFLQADSGYYDTQITKTRLLTVSVASIGFQPMVANFKVGQTAPVMYFFIALFWFLYREDKLAASGSALVGAVLFKPYIGAPLAVYARLNRLKGITGFAVTYIAANLLSILIWGYETTLQYYQIILAQLFEEGTVKAYDSFSAWSPSHIRILYWLGPLTFIVKGLLLLPFLALFGRSILELDDDPVPVFVLSLVILIFALEATSAIDMAVLLAALIVLGNRFYVQNERIAFVFLVVAFFSFQAHEYILELLVGWGATNISVITANEPLILTLIPILQPGTYAIGILYGLGVYAWTRPPNNEPRTLQELYQWSKSKE